MAVHFGKLLARLRNERGLTQSALAHASGLHVATIAKAEGSAECSFRRTNARELFEALERVGPIEPSLAAAYFRATGLDAAIASARELVESPEGVITQAIYRLKAVLPTDAERDALQYTFELIDAIGAEAVIDALRGMAAMSKVELSPAIAKAKPQAMRRVHAPRQLAPGIIEQVTEEVIITPAPKPAPKRRSRDERA